MENTVILNNVSALLKQLGHQIDAHEQQVEHKTHTQYQRNEQLVNNVINNLYVSLTVLVREVTKKNLFTTLKQTSEQLFEHFKLVGNVSFLSNAKEQEEKQNTLTAEVLSNVQRVWKTAVENTEPPEVSVETLLMSQAQDKFKELDCHRRVLIVALQTYQTNQLQNEIAFIKKVYDIKGHTLKAFWERVQLLCEKYREQCGQLVITTGNTVTRIQKENQTLTQELLQSVRAFMTRFTTLWKSYKENIQSVDDACTASNDLRVAIDTLLSGSSSESVKQAVDNARQASKLLKKHWSAAAKYIEEVPELTKKPQTGFPKKTSAALQKNADRMLFCAKNRAQVLKNVKSYPSTSAWIGALRKWDNAMSQLEKEAQVLRRGQAESLTEASSEAVDPQIVATHRQWKRLIFALEPLVSQLETKVKVVQDKQSSVYAVLLNKVGYELKQLTDRALQQLKHMEEQHVEYERALVEVEQENFKLLDSKFQSESSYMVSELQGYGPVSERCLDLITKLFKLKTWQEHATRLKQQLDVLQPLVVKVSMFASSQGM